MKELTAVLHESGKGNVATIQIEEVLSCKLISVAKEVPRLEMTFLFGHINLHDNLDQRTRIVKIPLGEEAELYARIWGTYRGELSMNHELSVTFNVKDLYNTYKEAAAAEMESVMRNG